MQAYLLRVIIALASVGLAPLATYLIDRGGVDVEQFRGIAQAARPIALLMLTVFLVAFAAKRPAGTHEPENTLDAPNFCSVWHHAAIVLYVVYGSPRSCDLPSARGARAPGARLLCASPMVRRRLLSADGCHRFSYQQNRMGMARGNGHLVVQPGRGNPAIAIHLGGDLLHIDGVGHRITGDRRHPA